MVLSSKARVRLLKGAVWFLGLSPLAWGFYRAFLGDGFGANPIEEIEHFTGDTTLIVLLTVLSITPLRRRPTLMFNGYGEQVAGLYARMDLRKWY